MPNFSYSWTLTNGTTADASQVQGNFDTVMAAVNGGLDAVNLTANTASILGLTRGAVGGRGKSIIAASESRSNVAYGTLPTPDKVTVTLPTDGLLFVAYHATWSATDITADAYAAIFLNAVQLKGAYLPAGGPAPVAQEANYSAAFATQQVPLFTTSQGLYGSSETGGWADVTTGQVLGEINDSAQAFGGGPVVVFAAAGTYDVSVKFRATASNTVTALNRKLWVWTMGFD